ncbi:unnamed protein product [Amoebophrya sp. A120]|nr:unnamed protein product [Amoebophrya sp. A120]|eukprot:GSA120T00019529001.1
MTIDRGASRSLRSSVLRLFRFYFSSCGPRLFPSQVNQKTNTMYPISRDPAELDARKADADSGYEHKKKENESKEQLIKVLYKKPQKLTEKPPMDLGSLSLEDEKKLAMAQKLAELRDRMKDTRKNIAWKKKIAAKKKAAPYPSGTRVHFGQRFPDPIAVDPDQYGGGQGPRSRGLVSGSNVAAGEEGRPQLRDPRDSSILQVFPELEYAKRKKQYMDNTTSIAKTVEKWRFVERQGLPTVEDVHNEVVNLKKQARFLLSNIKACKAKWFDHEQNAKLLQAEIDGLVARDSTNAVMNSFYEQTAADTTSSGAADAGGGAVVPGTTVIYSGFALGTGMENSKKPLKTSIVPYSCIPGMDVANRRSGKSRLPDYDSSGKFLTVASKNHILLTLSDGTKVLTEGLDPESPSRKVVDRSSRVDDETRAQIEAASGARETEISRATVVSASGATSTTSGIVAGDANAPPLQPQPGQLVPPAINPSSTAAGAVGAAGPPAGAVVAAPGIAGTTAPPATALAVGTTATMTPGSARIYHQAAPGAAALGAATIGSSLSQQQPLAPGTPPLSASGNAPPAASAIGPGVGVNNAGASTSTASTSLLPAPAPSSAMITAPKPTLPLPNATPVFGHAQQYQQSGPGGANVLSPMAQMARPAPVVVLPGASSASAGSNSFLSAAVNTGGPGGSMMKPQYG